MLYRNMDVELHPKWESQTWLGKENPARRRTLAKEHELDRNQRQKDDASGNINHYYIYCKIRHYLVCWKDVQLERIVNKVIISDYNCSSDYSQVKLLE